MRDRSTSVSCDERARSVVSRSAKPRSSGLSELSAPLNRSGITATVRGSPACPASDASCCTAVLASAKSSLRVNAASRDWSWLRTRLVRPNWMYEEYAAFAAARSPSSSSVRPR